MKPPRTQLRREFAFVAGVTLLALAPLAYLWRKSVLEQRKRVYAPGAVISVSPQGQNAYAIGEATISPDGRYFARMESAATQKGRTLSTNSLSASANELVIHSAQNGQEIFRAPSAGDFMDWIPSSSSFVTQHGDDLAVFTPKGGRAGGAGTLWTQRKLSFNADSGGISTSIGANGAQSLSLQMGAIALSPDGRYAVKGSWAKGGIIWQVADLKTKRVMAPVQAGKWLAYNPNVGGVSNDISIAVAPANIASGGRPLVSVLQTTEMLHLLAPTKTPLPTPTPKPTATFSPAQIQFNDKAAKEEAEIQKLVESVLGVDGADPEVTDEAEIKRIEAEVKRRNKALEAERQRVFHFAATPLPTPTQKPDPWKFTTPFQIETFDLSTGKRLWVAPVKAQVFTPCIQFSPDGSALVTSGTAAKGRQIFGGGVERTGVEFRAVRTGQLFGKTSLYEEDFGIPERSRLVFYSDPSILVNNSPRSILALKDGASDPPSPSRKPRSFGRNILFRLFNVSTAREVAYLRVESSYSTPQGFEQFSISQNGKEWLWGSNSVTVASRQELGQEFFAPMPTPTPYPTRSR